MKRTIVLLCIVLLVSVTWAIAQEQKTEKKGEMKGDDGLALKESIMRGKAMFADASLGTTGMSCNSCHVEGGTKAGKMGDKEIPPFKSVAKKYPGYFKMTEKVMTLDQVINFCIVTPMEGKPLAWDDQRLADLAAFVSYAEGIKIEMKKGESLEKEEEKGKGKK